MGSSGALVRIGLLVFVRAPLRWVTCIGRDLMDL